MSISSKFLCKFILNECIDNKIREKQVATQKNQQKKIEETEKLIDKFRAKASKASMAQSLMKKLDKIEIIEVDEEDSAVMNINFPLSRTPGRVVIEVDNCTKNYDGHVVFEKEVDYNLCHMQKFITY